jgi:DNA repair photolyase
MEMTYIYGPKGKAGEYGELALNIYKGCSHGCKYCYVSPILYQSPEQFHANPQARTLDYRTLNKELESFRGKSVFLCFTCDPYQPIDSDLEITREIIQRFRLFQISPNILTKGGLRSTRDFDLLARDPGAKYGATLTFLNPEDSLKWEPGAALPQERMDALKQAHDLGIKTWASLEPVIDPAQSLQIIQKTKNFVDEYKVGRWNHNPKANKIDWKTFGKKAVELCQEFEKKY